MYSFPKRPSIWRLDHRLGLVPEASPGETFELVDGLLSWLAARAIRERDVGPPEQRIVAQRVDRNRRAGVEIAAGELHADDQVRFQIDDRRAGRDAERGCVVAQEGDVREAELAAQQAGLDAPDVVE